MLTMCFATASVISLFAAAFCSSFLCWCASSRSQLSICAFDFGGTLLFLRRLARFLTGYHLSSPLFTALCFARRKKWVVVFDAHDGRCHDLEASKRASDPDYYLRLVCRWCCGHALQNVSEGLTSFQRLSHDLRQAIVHSSPSLTTHSARCRHGIKKQKSSFAALLLLLLLLPRRMDICFSRAPLTSHALLSSRVERRRRHVQSIQPLNRAFAG
ncbi:uncharacterized protein J3D65DRAFT_237764 [Phyllosticta citribraziliensis]|uniref:Secreted protein n=1 Tax=Phyllosticta citribraziliensis TaxID=989973 RepID=A0ABR1M2C2_9PEZI